MHFHELAFTPSGKPQKSKYSAKFPLKTIMRKITSTAQELISLCYIPLQIYSQTWVNEVHGAITKYPRITLYSGNSVAGKARDNSMN